MATITTPPNRGGGDFLGEQLEFLQFLNFTCEFHVYHRKNLL